MKYRDVIEPLAATTLPDTSRPHPKGWAPGITYDPSGPISFTTGPLLEPLHSADDTSWRELAAGLGLEVPQGWRIRLAEAKHDPVAWTREAQGEDAITRAVWRYRFVIEPVLIDLLREDADRIIRDAMRAKRPAPAVPAELRRGIVVVYADAQAGKVALLGGTEALAERVAACMGLLDAHLKDLKKVGRYPDEAAWLDAGDCVENFESTLQQAFTNDLTMTQQVRAHRRFTFEGLSFLARRFGKVTATACGSNHAQVRRGKERMGPPDDDWGLEVLTQVQDAYAHNVETFGHVGFAYPPKWRDTVCIPVAGVPIGLAHGHQVNRPEQIERWWKDQAFGGQPVSDARILITGHYHHWRSQQLGNDRLWLQAPTLDGGSDWFTQRSGEVSSPGMLVFSVTSDGRWDDLKILQP